MDINKTKLHYSTLCVLASSLCHSGVWVGPWRQSGGLWVGMLEMGLEENGLRTL